MGSIDIIKPLSNVQSMPSINLGNIREKFLGMPRIKPDYWVRSKYAPLCHAATPTIPNTLY